MDYQKQALDFLKEADALCKIEFIGKMINDAWKETKPRNCYQVTLSTPNGSYSFKFWDSLYNTEARCKLKPKEYDVLSCLTAYDVGGFSDFCADFGYDTDSISAFKTYISVQEEYHNLNKIFTKDQLEQLLNEII